MLFNLYRSYLRGPRFRGKHRVENWFRQRLLPPRTPVAGGLTMELDPQEWAQIALLSDGVTEPKTVALFNRLLNGGDTYIDVGAHVGFLTLMARKRVGASGRVIAIEPQPYNCEKILTNWRINRFGNILVYVAAAGDRNGTISLKAQVPTDKSRLTVAGEGVSDTAQTFIVPILRLDHVIAEQNVTRITLLKIDVEGLELEVLRGLGDNIGSRTSFSKCCPSRHFHS